MVYTHLQHRPPFEPSQRRSAPGSKMAADDLALLREARQCIGAAIGPSFPSTTRYGPEPILYVSVCVCVCTRVCIHARPFWLE